MKYSTAVKLIPVVWVISFVISAPSMVEYTVYYVHDVMLCDNKTLTNYTSSENNSTRLSSVSTLSEAIGSLGCRYYSSSSSMLIIRWRNINKADQNIVVNCEKKWRQNCSTCFMMRNSSPPTALFWCHFQRWRSKTVG